MDIDTTNYMYEWSIDDNVKIRAKECDYCFPGPGIYSIRLDVIDLVTGSVMFNEASQELEIEDIEQAYITSPDTIHVNQTIDLNGTRTYIKDFTVSRYYWDLGDYTRRSSADLTHSYYDPGIYTVKLGVTNDPDKEEVIHKSCSYKRIVVLPR